MDIRSTPALDEAASRPAESGHSPQPRNFIVPLVEADIQNAERRRLFAATLRGGSELKTVLLSYFGSRFAANAGFGLSGRSLSGMQRAVPSFFKTSWE